MPSLFDPIQLGNLSLNNRIVMAPLTRGRAIQERIPNDLMATYYEQRSSAGLIISEATSITPMAVGYANTPGIWNDAHVEGWKDITDSVHAKGGKIMLQLWHVGAVSDPVFLNGELPVAPSAIAIQGHVSRVRPLKPYVVPRALELEEIPRIVNDYGNAAKRAKEAGFDGVEIHGANGYLIDQFLYASSNVRTDIYGGSIENRSRFLNEVVDEIIKHWDPQNVGLHLAPRPDPKAMGDEDSKKLFSAVANDMAKRNIAFIFCREALKETWLTQLIKEEFKGSVIANDSFTLETASEVISKGLVDAVAFGRDYISNPDLVYRFKNNAPLNEQKSELFYGDGAEGYTDYPCINRD